MSSYREQLKEHFESNMLDGDKVEDCGDAMLHAENVWEYVQEVVAQKQKEARIDELERLTNSYDSDLGWDISDRLLKLTTTEEEQHDQSPR